MNSEGSFYHDIAHICFLGHVTLTQIPVICRHLGEIFGLRPESAEDQLHAEQICHACHDFLLEGIYPIFL